MLVRNRKAQGGSQNGRPHLIMVQQKKSWNWTKGGRGRGGRHYAGVRGNRPWHKE